MKQINDFCRTRHFSGSVANRIGYFPWENSEGFLQLAEQNDTHLMAFLGFKTNPSESQVLELTERWNPDSCGDKRMNQKYELNLITVNKETGNR